MVTLVEANSGVSAGQPLVELEGNRGKLFLTICLVAWQIIYLKQIAENVNLSKYQIGTNARATCQGGKLVKTLTRQIPKYCNLTFERKGKNRNIRIDC